MRKLATGSLIASCVLTSSIYAQSINEAFNETKLKGEIKTEYSKSNFLGKSDSDDMWAVGGSLSALTGDFYGFKAGATFQTSTLLSEDRDNEVFKNDLDVSDAVLSEAFLEYKISNTTLKAGRQFISTPLLSTSVEGKSSESIIKDSFEAYLLTNTDIQNTTLVAGYVNKYQAKTDGNKDVGDFQDDTMEDGAYTLYVKNNSIENLTLQGQYIDVNAEDSTNERNALYFQADYKLGHHTISAQYLASEKDSKDGELFGFKFMGPLGIGKLGYLLAYSSSTKENEVYTGEGTGTTDTIFSAMPVHGGGVPVRADTDTIVGGIIIPIAGATFIPYCGKSYRDVGLGDVYAAGAMVMYPFNKQLSLKLSHEYVEIENTINPAGIVDEDTNTTRVYLTYKF